MFKKPHTEEMDFEIRFCEELLKKKPDFVEAMQLLGNLYTQKGEYQKGLAMDEQLAQLKPRDPVVLYNLACSYSLINDTNKALRAIKKAVNCGYDNFFHLEQDSDLENLRQDGRFRRYLERVKSKKFKDKESVA